MRPVSAVWLMSLPLALACQNPKSSEAPEALLESGFIDSLLTNPFPSRFLLDADGFVDLGGGLLAVDSNSPLPVERLRWRTGFSPSQTVVIDLPTVDSSSFLSWRAPEPGEGGVRMFDRTTSTWLPCLAELDAHDGVTEPALLIRPLVALEDGHDVGVVLTTDVTDRVGPFQAVLDGSSFDVAGVAEETRALVDELETAGMDRSEIALAFDFPIHGGTELLTSALQYAEVKDHRFTEVRTLGDDSTDPPPPLTWRVAKGTMDIPNQLDDNNLLLQDSNGSVQTDGVRPALLHVNIPESVADAPERSVPVWVFGHGMLHDVDEYLDDLDDGDSTFQLVHDAEVLVVATSWTGLTPDDLTNVAIATADISRFPSIPDQLVQAHTATHALTELVANGDLFEDPALRGRSGQVLADPDQIFYFGISLGGVMGPTFVANDPPIRAAAFHVGGGMIMTLLERGYFWNQFATGLGIAVNDPLERQRTLAAAQLFADPIDPMSHLGRLGDVPVLWQEALGDDTVHNLTTRAVARSLGVTAQGPFVDMPWGFDDTLLDLPAGSSAYTQHDPELGQPDQGNTPAERTYAHAVPRDFPGTQQQLRTFLHPDAPGRVIHACGTSTCSSSNPGTP